MLKLLLFLLVSPAIFGQPENQKAMDSAMTEKILAEKTIGILGYQFQQGGFLNTRISDTWNLQTGLFHTNSDNFKIVEFPFILKKDLSSNFRASFGSRAQLVIDNGFSTLQPLSTGSKSFSASGDFGMQYDVSGNLMIQFRYSLPIIEQSTIYPSTPNLDSGGLLYLSTGFKF